MYTTQYWVILLLTLVTGISALGFDINNWLNQFQFHVDPTLNNLFNGRACRDCTRTKYRSKKQVSPALARFGFGTIITPAPTVTLPCCPTPTTTPDNCKCGVEGASRIVGGTVSTAGKYPWIGAVNFNNNPVQPGGCAATLIAAEWAITTAHCMVGETVDTISLVFGEFDLTVNGDSLDGKRLNVKLAHDPIVHEQYQSPKVNSNDIALLKLETVNLGDFTPACLPAVDTDYTGKTGHVYGWGSLAACPSAVHNVLNEVSVPIILDAECETSSGTPVLENDLGQCFTRPASYFGQISPDMMCAGEKGKDACQGDSGGPFTVKEVDQHFLAGVVSWGYGCGAEDLPGVYAEVALLRTWVDTNIAANGGATYCPT